jgi:DNA polymerase-3 subunit alpha
MQDKGLGVPRIIRFGLSAVKNVGEHICDVIYTERKKNGAYQSLEDFLKRVDDKDLNKKSLESLIQAGALDCFGFDRAKLLDNIENILSFVRTARESSVSNQHSLFGAMGLALDSKVVLKGERQASLEEKMQWEKNLLGFYLSAHPFEYFQKVMKNVLVPLNNLESQNRDQWVVIGGVIDGLEKKISKKGGIMMFATLEDTTGKAELLVFPRAYEQTQAVWQEGNLVCVVGRTGKEDGDNKIFVEKAASLTKQNALQVCNQLSYGLSVKDYAPQMQENNSLVLNLTKEELKKYSPALKEVFLEYPGDYQVYIKVGEKTIRAQSLVDWNSAVLEKLENIVGEGKVEVFE